MHTNDDTASRTATIARLNDNARLGLDRRARVQFTSNCLETFRPTPETHVAFVQAELHKAFRHCEFAEIGRASGRERVFQYVYISVGAQPLTKKKNKMMRESVYTA